MSGGHFIADQLVQDRRVHGDALLDEALLLRDGGVALGGGEQGGEAARVALQRVASKPSAHHKHTKQI